MNPTYRIPLVVAAMAMMLSACKPGSSYNPKDVAATVNGVPIGKERIDMIVKQRAMQRPDSPEFRKEIVENLATQILASEEGLKKGVDKKPEVYEQMEMARRSILANAFVEDYIKNNPVTDAMLKEAYDKFKAEQGVNEYKTRHILVDKESDAKDIIAKVKKDPKAFAGIAKEKSKDPGSKGTGGDLGWIDARAMVPEFSSAVTSLEKGKLTDAPVKSQFGYHVIIVDDVRPKAVPAFEEVKDMLKQDVQQKSLRKLLEDMKAKAKIDIKQTAPATPPAPPAPAPGAPASPAPAPAEAPKQ